MNVYKRRNNELWKLDTLNIWETDYGFHKIPKDFDDVKFKKNGQPDKRFKRTKDFYIWTSNLDK
jgi:hypothetical protein